MKFLVIPAVDEPIGSLPDHAPAPGIDRLALLTRGTLPGRSFHCAAHAVSGEHLTPEGDTWRYTTPHAHDHDEFNILLPAPGHVLRYKYEIDGEQVSVEGPCSVFLAAGVLHRMEPVEGRGTFLCLHVGPQR